MRENIKDITEQLMSGINALKDSVWYKNYLDTMSKFYHYSFYNSLLIAMQMPEATYVAGYRAWQTKFGRQVNKGAKAIKILAPIPHKYKKEVNGEEQEFTYTTYRAVNVFDVSQTSGDALPAICKELYGDIEGYDELLNRFVTAAEIPVIFEDINSGAYGFFDQIAKRIVIKKNLSNNQTLKTLLHEIAHSILHGADGIAKDAPRKIKEMQAESIAYIVSKQFGISTDDYSFGYILGWNGDEDTEQIKESMEVIVGGAKEIMRRLES